MSPAKYAILEIVHEIRDICKCILPLPHNTYLTQAKPIICMMNSRAKILVNERILSGTDTQTHCRKRTAFSPFSMNQSFKLCEKTDHHLQTEGGLNKLSCQGKQNPFSQTRCKLRLMRGKLILNVSGVEFRR